jgi:hypothetical protein
MPLAFVPFLRPLSLLIRHSIFLEREDPISVLLHANDRPASFGRLADRAVSLCQTFRVTYESDYTDPPPKSYIIRILVVSLPKSFSSFQYK